MFHLRERAPDAPTVVARARERGVGLIAFGPRTLRVVTHLEVTRAQCTEAADILAALCSIDS
jgi:threonine aldolase